MSAAVTILALRLADLSDLAHWPPVGALAEVVVEAATGHGGLTEQEVQRVLDWSARWVKVRPEIRALYVRYVDDDPAVWHALRCLLNGGPRPAGAVSGRLAELWLEDHGYDPPFTLCPIIKSA